MNTLGYEAMYNPMSGDCYSVTRISDVILYSEGEGTPTLDKLVDPNAPDTPAEDETDPADSTHTNAPDTMDTQEPDTPAETNTSEKGKGCRSSIPAVAVPALIACAAACVSQKEKRF